MTKVVCAYVRSLISADMMRIQTGYEMERLHSATVASFFLFDKLRKEFVLTRLEESIDKAIQNAFDEIMLDELRKVGAPKMKHNIICSRVVT